MVVRLLVGPRHDDDRDQPFGVPLVLSEVRHQGGLGGEEAVALLPFGDAGLGQVGVARQLDGDGGVGEQVAVPIGVGRGARFGGDDDDLVAVFGVDQRRGAGLAALGAGGGEEDERGAANMPVTLPSLARNSSMIWRLKANMSIPSDIGAPSWWIGGGADAPCTGRVAAYEKESTTRLGSWGEERGRLGAEMAARLAGTWKICSCDDKWCLIETSSLGARWRGREAPRSPRLGRSGCKIAQGAPNFQTSSR